MSNNCLLCKEDECNKDNEDFQIVKGIIGTRLRIESTHEVMYYQIKYCPMCGRKLEGEN